MRPAGEDDAEHAVGGMCIAGDRVRVPEVSRGVGGLRSPVKHLVEIADLEHEDMLRLRLLELRPLVDEAAWGRLAAFDRAAAASVSQIKPHESRAESPKTEGCEQQRGGCARWPSHHEVRFRVGAYHGARSGGGEKPAAFYARHLHNKYYAEG